MSAPFAKLVVGGTEFSSAGQTSAPPVSGKPLAGARDGEGREPDALRIGPCASSLLALVAAFHGMTPAQWVESEIVAACGRIGIARLADVEKAMKS